MTLFHNFAKALFNDNSNGELLPRNKFNFSIILESNINDKISNTIFYRVLNATLPGFSFDTDILNQYNKKRVIQKRINYDPVTISFLDTHDNLFHDILKRLYKNII